MWQKIKPRAATLRAWQLGLLVLMFLFWDAMTPVSYTHLTLPTNREV